MTRDFRIKGPFLWQFRDVQTLKADPDYDSAKAGNLEAAVRLVMRCADSDFLKNARQEFGRNAVYVPVRAEEAQGRNNIPVVLAEYLSAKTGAGIDMDIVQSNRAFHTGAKAMERLLVRAEFAGPVQPGARYVLVDDVTTMGSTLADLASYIQCQGGEVAGSLVLTNAMRELTMNPSQQRIQKLEVRHGQFIQDLLGIATEALTASEAGYLIGFRTTDELRDRAVKARGERSARILSKAVLRNESAISAPENSDHPKALVPNPSDDLKAQRLGTDLSRPTEVDAPDTLQTHPPPAVNTLQRNQTPIPTPSQEHAPMAAQMKSLFFYGPLDVQQDQSSHALHIVHADMGSAATLDPDDPLHKQVLQTIEKNPHSKGFVANQIHAKVTQERRWDERDLDAEGLRLGPAREKTIAQNSGMEVTPIDLSSPEGKALLALLESDGVRLRDPAEYDPASPEIPPVAKDAASTLAKVQPVLDAPSAASSMKMQQQLLSPEEYQTHKYQQGVPQVGWNASALIDRQIKRLDPERVMDTGDLAKDTTKVSAPKPPGKETEQKQAPVDVLKDWPTAAPVPPLHLDQDKAPDRPTFARQKPVPLLAHKNRPLVLDHGDHITVTRRAMMGIGRSAQEKRELAVGTALQAAADRFGQPVHFTGNPAFLKQTAEMAVRMGIKLEPGDRQAAKVYETALKEQEKSLAPRGNVLGPARQPLQRRQDMELE